MQTFLVIPTFGTTRTKIEENIPPSPTTENQNIAPFMTDKNMENEHAYVKTSSTSGRGLFAKIDNRAGKQIFSIERPLIAVLDSARCGDCCSNCFSSTSPPVASYETWGDTYRHEMKACSQCKILKFCDRVRCDFLLLLWYPVLAKHLANTRFLDMSS